MYIRTTSMSTANSLMDYVSTGTSRYNELMQQVSTGKKLNSAADNATDAIGVLNLNKELSQMDGYLKSMSSAQNELNVLDSTMATLDKNLMRFNDLTLQAANQTYDETALKNIKTEMDSILENIISLGNTKFNGNYIFAGTNTGTAPFERTPDGGVNYTGTPASGDFERKIQISEGVSTKINVAGDSLFGSYDAATDTGSGILKTLFDVSNALGETPPDTDKARAGLDGLDKASKQTNTIRAEFGGISQQFKMTKGTIENNQLNLKAFKSSLEDIDITSAISDLTMQEYLLQATMAVASKSMSTSLLNYL